MKAFHISLCVLAMAGAAQAASPTLSISQVTPASLRFSWPSNFMDWQLMSSTNLSSWQSVTQAPLVSGNLLAVSLPLSDKRAFFRLQQTNSGCVFANASNWNATLTFAYNQTSSAPGFQFSVARSAVSVTFHLIPTNGIFAFDGNNAGGTVSINDEEDDSSGGSLITTKVFGTNSPMLQLSTFTLSVNCANGTYNFAAIVAVDGTETVISQGISDSFPSTDIDGQVAIFPRALPTGSNTLAGSAIIPTVGPFTVPTNDYFTPNDSIANDMWVDGAVSDATASPASVTWSITPAP